MAKKKKDAPQEAAEVTTEPTEAEKVEEAQEGNEYKELAQRIQADFDNFRKRNASARADARKEGVTEAVLKLLPVVDSMEAGLKIYREQGEKELVEGYEKLIQQFLAQLESLGVTRIESLGVPFDPNNHEAILQQPREDVESGDVAEVYRDGYLYGDTVIRPAQVIVAE